MAISATDSESKRSIDKSKESRMSDTKTTITDKTESETKTNSSSKTKAKTNKSVSKTDHPKSSDRSKTDKENSSKTQLSEITNSESTTIKYEVNEIVLAHHRDMLYEAKILKEKVANGVPQYYIHYQGWGKKHDEWIEHSKLLKKTPDSELLRQKMEAEMKRIQAEAKKRKAGGKSATSGQKSKKAKLDPTDSTVDMDDVSKSNRINIPVNLKKQLIVDWENTTRKQMLIPLPRIPNIDDLLEQYVSSQTNETHQHLTKEVCEGLKHYFNRALPTVLLYRFERPQWKAMKEKYPDKEMTAIYGSEHLLRLFVKLPSLLTHTQMSESENKLLRDQLNQILIWMDRQSSVSSDKTKDQKDFFLKELLPTDSAYVALVEQ